MATAPNEPMKFASKLIAPLTYTIITNAPTTGCIDTSLGKWKLTTASLVITDATGASEEMARTSVENFACGGYDLDLLTKNTHVAAAMATLARNWHSGYNRGDNLALIGEWIVANPESLSTSYEDAPF